LLRATGLVEKVAIDNFAATPFTQVPNLAGLPAMSVPLHWTSDGLPVGVQFVAPFANEAVLFRLAAQLEQAAPWFERRPAR
jgi:amidase